MSGLGLNIEPVGLGLAPAGLGTGAIGESFAAFLLPTTFPPEAGATDTWNWGQATSATYVSEIQGDTYKAGTGGTPGHRYGQAGPSAGLNCIYWRNTAASNSHHTAPGTSAGGQSSGAVSATMKPLMSSFKFYFLMSHEDGPDNNYTFFDYDQNQSAATLIPGLQFFVGTAGLFAPCSLVCTLKDAAGNLAEFHAKTGGTRIFEDSQWHLIEMIFDRTQSTPSFKIDGQALHVFNTFGLTALNALATINPAAGIRFAQKEWSQTSTSRSDLKMAAAAYAKNLNYTWK